MRISSDSVLPCCDTFPKKNFPMAQFHGMIFCCQGYLNIMFFPFFLILSVQCGTCDTKPGFRSLQRKVKYILNVILVKPFQRGFFPVFLVRFTDMFHRQYAYTMNVSKPFLIILEQLQLTTKLIEAICPTGPFERFATSKGGNTYTDYRQPVRATCRRYRKPGFE